MRVIIERGIVKDIVDGAALPDPLPAGLVVVDAPPNVRPGWGYNGSLFKMPTSTGEIDPPHPNHRNAQKAKRQLTESERAITHFYELATPVSQDWITYRSTLRSIIQLENDQSTPPITVPSRPPLPPGMIEPGL